MLLPSGDGCSPPVLSLSGARLSIVYLGRIWAVFGLESDVVGGILACSKMLWEPSVIQVQHAMIAAINTTHACRMIKGEGVNIKGAKIPDYYRDGYFG
eukprot:45802-Pyramimonas_sp.AAC.1